MQKFRAYMAGLPRGQYRSGLIRRQAAAAARVLEALSWKEMTIFQEGK
jgi:hypothetical protein